METSWSDREINSVHCILNKSAQVGSMKSRAFTKPFKTLVRRTNLDPIVVSLSADITWLMIPADEMEAFLARLCRRLRIEAKLRGLQKEGKETGLQGLRDVDLASFGGTQRCSVP